MGSSIGWRSEMALVLFLLRKLNKLTAHLLGSTPDFLTFHYMGEKTMRYERESRMSGSMHININIIGRPHIC